MEWIWTVGVCFGLVCSVVPSSAQNSSSHVYLISGPEVLHGGTPTLLAVTLLTESSVSVRAQVTQGNVPLAQAEDVLQGGLTGILTLPPIPGSSVNQSSPLTLEVQGYQRDKLVFINTTTIVFSDKTICSFIQTDRSHYCPGDKVYIRIISVQPDNRPYSGSVDDISIRDPRGNVVQRLDSVDGHLGIVPTIFSLSQTPPLGRWTITATVNGSVSDESFHVEDYEPPHFEVLVKTAPEVLAGDDISGTVEAQHHSGQPVQGTVSISVKLVSHPDRPVILNQAKEIQGSAQFFFSKDQLPALHQYSSPLRSSNYNRLSVSATADDDEDDDNDDDDDDDDNDIVIYITVHVTESSTGYEVKRGVTVHVTENAFQLSFSNFPRALKPSLLFYMTVKITRHDRKPLSSSDRQHSLLVEVAQRTLEGSTAYESTTITRSLPEDGNVHVQLRLQDVVEMVLIKATFFSSVETLELYRGVTSPSGSYVQILPINVLPAQIGSPLQIEVESTFQLDRLHYVVSSRGQVVAAGTEASSTFSLNPTGPMSPEACLTVYCVLHDGEVTTDTVHIPVHQHNKVSLSWSRDTARPGDLVPLTITVPEHGSRVALLVLGMDDDHPAFNQDIKEEKERNIVVLTDAVLYETQRPSGSEAGDSEEDDDLMREEHWSHWMERGSTDIWLWMDTIVSDSTQTSLDVTVPDRITSWRAVGLVMSENLGLGLSPVAQMLTVSQDISLSLNVPSWLIRGEELVLEVTVFNHLEQDIHEAIVMVAESEAYEFVLAEQWDISMVNARKIHVGSRSAASALFPIRLLALGDVDIAVDTVSSEARDSIVRTVHVKPGGVEQTFSQTLFLELAPRERNLSRNVSFSFPPDVVAGSQRAHVAVVGDILALSIDRLDSLVQMPHGCGEQNMIHFAPSVYVLQYLSKSAWDNEMLRTRALGYMMEGYQRELTYQRDDGSFSAFGASDTSGSTWLTAFVLRSLLQAEPFMQVDRGVISSALTWLVSHQGTQGQFTEVGRVIHTALQGGLEDGPVTLTAYVLMALLEDEVYVEMFEQSKSMARTYLENKVSSGIVSNYSLCLVSYALALANSRVAAVALGELSRRADYIDGVMLWRPSGGQGSNAWQPPSAQIEMVAYVLLALYRRASVVEGIALMKWLSRQRNAQGAYGTTQDTVVALQALSCYAAFSGANAIDLRLKIHTSPSSSVSHLSINSTNFLAYQKREIDAERDLLIDVSMEGRGFALFQMNAFYNLEGRVLQDTADHEAFYLNAVVFDSEKDLNRILLSICTRLLENQETAQTGMSMLEVDILSGFSLAPGATALGDLVRKVERSPGKLSLYLDSLNRSEVCIRIPLIRDFKVARVHDATVLVYDYYEPTRRAIRTYNSVLMHNMDSCVLCGGDCSHCGTGITIIVSSSSLFHPVSSATYCLGGLLAAIAGLLL